MIGWQISRVEICNLVTIHGIIHLAKPCIFYIGFATLLWLGSNYPDHRCGWHVVDNHINFDRFFCYVQEHPSFGLRAGYSG